MAALVIAVVQSNVSIHYSLDRLGDKHQSILFCKIYRTGVQSDRLIVFREAIVVLLKRTIETNNVVEEIQAVSTSWRPRFPVKLND